jgi:excisionase family DNA binding protein
MSTQTPNTSDVSGFAKISEAATFLNLSKAMIHKMVRDGRIPSRRIGKVYRIPWSWLKDFSTFPTAG